MQNNIIAKLSANLHELSSFSLAFGEKGSHLPMKGILRFFTNAYRTWEYAYKTGSEFSEHTACLVKTLPVLLDFKMLNTVLSNTAIM